MRTHTHLALLCTVIVIGLLISPVMAVKAAQGEEIYHPFNKAQECPDIDGNLIVWEDDRYDELERGVKDIFLATVEDIRSTPYGYSFGTRITDDPASQEKPSISGDYIVWQDSRHGNWDIYLYQRSTGEETRLTTDMGKQWLPAICGNYAAWYDDSSGRTKIVLYDIAARAVKDVIDCDAKTTIPYGSTGFKPALSENYVAWMEETDWKVHYYDIAAGRIIGPVSPGTAIQSWPSLSGSLITWEDERYGNPDIYMTNLDDPSGGEKRITSDTRDQVSAAISGNLIAWEDKRVPSRSIYMYDLAPPGEELSVVDAADIYDEHLYPTVSGNTIVWQRGRGPDSNLYIFIYELGGPTEPILTTVEVAPTTTTLEIGGTQEFSTTVRDQSGNVMTGVSVAWTSSNETIGTITGSGVFTALAAGTATVTATADGVSGTATVTVSDEEPILTGINVAPATATVMVDDTLTFSATGLDQFDNTMTTDITVVWTSSNETVGTIGTDGVFAAHAAGTTTITASADGVTGTAIVTVAAEAPVITSITVAPTTATLEVGSTRMFQATVLDQFDSIMLDVAVAWASSDETVGTIGTDGVFAAHAAGTTTVTASADGVSGTATVTVAAEEPALGRIVVSPSAVTLSINDAWQFDAVVFDRFGAIVPDAEVAWASSDETVGTIGADGVFTAHAAGTTLVTASAEGITGTAAVTVAAREQVLTSISVAPPAITIAVGETEPFVATCYDQDGSVMSCTGVTWASSNEAVGMIGTDGAFVALAAGTTTVTASAGDVTGTAAVTVTDQSSGVVVSPSAVTLDTGDSRRFTAIVFDPEGNVTSGAVVTWSCDDETVGTISTDGIFTAGDEGMATITASADGVSGTATVTVRPAPPTLARVVVSPSDLTIAAGNSAALTATVFDRQGFAMDAAITWTSSDETVGTVGTDGVFVALAPGIATVTASAEGVSGTTSVTVEPSLSVPTCIEIEPATVALKAGETRVFTATVFDQCDNEMDWVRVAWSSSSPQVGAIDGTGLFTALGEGIACVTASAGSVEKMVAVTVTGGSAPAPSGGGYSGGGSSGPTFDAGTCQNLKNGETFTFSGITTSSVDSISITAADTIPNLMVTVKGADSPSGTEPPAGDVYEYVEITLQWANPQDIGNATVIFTIPAAWLEAHGVAPEDIVLMRCVNGAWQTLETEVIGEENGHYRFRATTPGFSTFAIAATAPMNVTTPVETVPTATGEETNVTQPTETPTVEATTEATTVPATTPAAPLVYAPLLAPLAFLLWRRKKN